MVEGNEAADVLIIGGGAAGCVLASRLSEDPRRRVVLVEAGPDFGMEPPADIADPFPRAYANPAYFTQDLSALVTGPADRRPFTQAHVLGGGSTVMGMWALRGLAEDYNGWRVPGWSWDEVQPYFRKLERDMDFRGPLHGDGGPVPIRRVRRELWPPFARMLEHEAVGCGLPALDDANGRDEDGAYPLPISADDAGRGSSTRYLDAAVRARPNLRILARAEGERIAFDAQRRAVGAHLMQDGRPYLVNAAHTVVAAGAIGSPALLMRSGVGEPEALKRLGVEIVTPSPGVGANLANHVFLHLAGFVPGRFRQARSLRNYVTAIVRFSSGHEGAPASDMMLSSIAKPGAHFGGEALALLGVHLNAPFSRGAVTLVRRDGQLKADIDFRLLSDPRDLPRLTDAARFGAKLLSGVERRGGVTDPFLAPASAPIRALNAPGRGSQWRTLGLWGLAATPQSLRRRLLQIALPGALHLDEIEEGRFGEAMRGAALPMFHVGGTCALGVVVDPGLAVSGVERLYVADASIMPRIPRANTNIPTVMIGERASDLIAEHMR